VRSVKIVVSFIVTVILFGCASTSMTRFKDPDYQNAHFKRVLIIAITNNFGDRQKLESKMVKAFSIVGIYALESYKLFPPTRDLTNKEKANLLHHNNMDALLLMSPGTNGVSSYYVPITSSTTTTEGNIQVSGHTGYYSQESTTTHQGGYTLHKPWANFQTKLIDASNGKTVWIASSFSSGNPKFDS